MRLTETLALLLSAAGVGAVLLGVGARRPRAGLTMLLDLWMGSAAWEAVLAAALLVGARALLTLRRALSPRP